MSGEYGFKDYLYKVLEELVKTLLDNKKSQDIKFYTYGFVGTIIDWVQTEMKTSPDELATWMSEKFNKRS